MSRKFSRRSTASWRAEGCPDGFVFWTGGLRDFDLPTMHEPPKSFVLTAGLIAAPVIYFAQITSAEGDTTQVKEGRPLRFRFEMGAGRSSAQWKDADGEHMGDVRNPARGYVFGVTLTTEEKSRHTGFFSLHYLRRG